MRRVTDEHCYTEKLTRQQTPGLYHLHASQLLPTDNAIPNDPYIRPQYTGAALSRTFTPVLAESDLRGLDRPLSNAPIGSLGGSHSNTPHYTPSSVSFSNDTPAQDSTHLRTMTSRLDLPPIALKGLAPNRFDPVQFHNPAENTMTPFDRLVSSRIVAKDQWKIPASSLNRVNPPTIGGKVNHKLPPLIGIPYSTSKTNTSYQSKMIVNY